MVLLFLDLAHILYKQWLVLYQYFNPGESVKDRAALFIVQDAIKRKLISKGGTIVEGTAGNTGIGLAIVCKEYELNLKIVIPKTQSIEKKETLRKLGAELIEVDAVPYSDPKNYIKQSKQIADDLNKTSSYGVYWANQFDNVINTEAHIQTTAEEIWGQTAGTVDGFACAVGTGGISGRIIEQTVTFIGKEDVKIGDKVYKTLRFNFKSSDETLPESKRLNTDIWYEENTYLWVKAAFEKTGYWEYRLKKYN